MGAKPSIGLAICIISAPFELGRLDTRREI
jgi:hypothetical protein